jgi:hypothetical protein
MFRDRLLLLLLSSLLAGCSFYDRRAPSAGAEITLQLPRGASPADTEATIAVLRKRIEPAGWRWSEFTPSGDSIRVRVGPLDDITRPALLRLLTLPYRMELHVVPSGADPATHPRQGTPVFTNADVKLSYLEAMSKGSRLNLDLHPEAARRLMAATSPDGGGLVLFVDDEREMATHLNGPLRGGILKLRPAGETKEAIHLRAVELISALKAGELSVVPTGATVTTWAE